MEKMGFLSLVAVLCCAHLAYGDIHSHMVIYTASSGIPGIPEFVCATSVDGQPIYYYDSTIKELIPKQEWVKGAVDSDFWKRNRDIGSNAHQVFKANIEIARQRFNQTEGAHAFQKMYGCEWDDETQETTGFRQYGYDGEDFLVYDMKTFSWVAPVQQAESTQRKWNNLPGEIEQRKHYITQECIEWLQKYVKYGKASFQSKVSRPVGTLLQKSSSGVACHATGFYPDSVMITWKKNGQEMDDDVDVGETLPNEDGTFQKRAVLTVSPEERKNAQYSCEVTHKSGEPLVLIFEEENNNVPAIVGGCVFAAVVIIVAVVVIVMKKKKDYNKAPQSDTSSDNSEPTKA